MGRRCGTPAPAGWATRRSPTSSTAGSTWYSAAAASSTPSRCHDSPDADEATARRTIESRRTATRTLRARPDERDVRIRAAADRRRYQANCEPSGRKYTGRRSEEHTSELQSPCNLVCRLLPEKKNACERTRI